MNSAIEYEQKDDVHGVKLISDEKEGWTPVIGKRSRHKVPTCLLRLRAPPHVCASLPSSDSSTGETSDSDCSLHIPASADVVTHLTVENQASGLQPRALPVGLPFPQQLDLNLNN